MLQNICLTVNGAKRELAVDHRCSLAELLREQLGLTSVKQGCGVGECGACTVLLDGETINSCIYPALWANGKSVLTVEGLNNCNGELSRVQKAFISEAAVQCGFCTPGLIMTGTKLALKGGRYDREALRREISGHLCRCTGYENILNALEKALNECREL
jgi:carbon-monoxide dehydrogenase small subunit